MDADVIVIGGGAAGILAAWRAANLGARTLILEKTVRLGTKILISGGGKCNITHDGHIQEVLSAFRPAEARFIRPACFRWRNSDTVKLLTQRGLRVYTRPDGRIFPVDQTARDVMRILESYLRDAHVQTRLESPVVNLTRIDEAWRVDTGSANAPHTGYRAAANDPVAKFTAPTVILATGGSSYPNSGTTGDGWPWMRALGHTIRPIRAALAPIELRPEHQRPDFSGIALRDVIVKARCEGKEIDRWRGDLLFTHRGLSGPTILGISRAIAERIDGTPISIDVDLRPDESPEATGDTLRSISQPHRRVAAWVAEFVPDRLAEAVLDAARIPPDTSFGRLDRKSRNRLAETIRRWELGRVRTVPLDKGEVVAGGVALEEIDPQTMASLRAPGLFLCGEVLDIAGPVGGYNLTAAFATGYVAGESAAAATGYPASIAR